MFKNKIQIENSELCITSGGAEGAACPTVAMRRQKNLENSKKSGNENEMRIQDGVKTQKGSERERSKRLMMDKGLWEDKQGKWLHGLE